MSYIFYIYFIFLSYISYIFYFFYMFYMFYIYCYYVFINDPLKNKSMDYIFIKCIKTPVYALIFSKLNFIYYYKLFYIIYKI